MRNLSIVQATYADVDALVPLFDSYRAFFAGRSDAVQSRRFLEERLRLDDSVVFLARAGAAAAGFLQLYPLWSSWYCRRIWFLSDLYVRDPDRRAGIGQRLVERALAHAHATGASSVMVELPHREPHLRAFYARFGFTRDDVFDLARRTFDAS